MKQASLAFGILFLAAAAPPPQQAPEVDVSDFERLHQEILPAPGESPWREIPWIISVTRARERAVSEDKPIIIFTAADGSPLGRT